jgi:hypothetical protein
MDTCAECGAPLGSERHRVELEPPQVFCSLVCVFEAGCKHARRLLRAQNSPSQALESLATFNEAFQREVLDPSRGEPTCLHRPIFVDVVTGVCKLCKRKVR